MKTKKNFNPLVIPAVLIIGCTAYFLLKRATSPSSNREIVESIVTDFNEDSLTYLRMANEINELRSIRSNWEIDNHPGLGMKFFSFSPLDTTKISLSDFQKKYYGDKDSTVSPNYIPDFPIPNNLKHFLESKKLRKVHFMNSQRQRIISFKYKYQTFYPLDRVVNLIYFSDTTLSVKKNAPGENESNWRFPISKNWLIESSQEQ